MYSTHNRMAKIDKNDFVMVFYQIMMISGTIMAMYPIWPLSVRFEIKETIVKVWWNIAIFYMLVFLNGFFLMVSGFYHLQFAVFTINTILTIVLAGWRLASVMIVAGFYLSIQFYEYYAGIESLDFFVGSLSFVFFYVLLLIGTVLVIFLKPKQEHQEATETRAEQLEGKVGELQQELAKHQHQYVETTATQVATLQKELKKRDGQLHEKEIYLSDKLRLMAIELDRVRDMKNEFLRNIPSEKNNSLVGVLSLSEALHDLYDKMDEKSIKEVIKDIINSGDRLKSYVNSMTDLSKIRSLSYKLDTKPVNLSLLAKRRPTLYKKIFSDEAGKQQFKFDIEPDIMVNCDEYYITQAIDNLIRNAVSYGKGLPINISLHKIKDGMVKFTISDSGIGIPKDELVEIFNVFTTSSRTKSAAGGRGIGLSLCEKVVQLHKGEIKAESDGASGSSFYFTLPI